MTATQVPGVPTVEVGHLVSTNPATGAEVGRFPIADPPAVGAAVDRARDAAAWWLDIGFTGRRQHLLRWAAVMARRLDELTLLMHREGGKPVADATVEAVGAVDHVSWAARNARKVLGPTRVRGSLLQSEYAAHLEYHPYGVVGVIGPWNYPVLTPIGSIAYALAAGNAVVFKPSEYTPAVGAWLVDTFAEVAGGAPVLQGIYGMGDVGGALVNSGVDKIAFTGSARTGRKVLAAAAQTMTPVLLECGGKDAMIVDSDADIEAAAVAAVWGGMTNAGQTCVGIERVYVVDEVYDAFLPRLVDKAGRLRVGAEPDADVGPMTMPAQLNVVRQHIEDALDRGGRAVLGGRDAVRPPFVHPTILVDVPEDSAAVTEETFGPTLTVKRVRDVEEAVALANATAYGLGSSVFGRARAMQTARRLRSGMTAVNSALSFAGIPSLPFGGVGASGFGRIHGADGLREFARPKAIARRRLKSYVPALSFERSTRTIAIVTKAAQLRHGRAR